MGDDDNGESNRNWRDAICTSDKRLCAKLGYGFDECVAKAYPIDDSFLEETATDCWFVSKEIRNMKPNEKRNVLYWWFMVNVYHIGGKGKRRCPPKCLIKAIREKYPNPDGVPYVDFKPSNKKRRT